MLSIRGQRALASVVALATSAAAQEIPSRLADSTYWRLVTEFSEPSGNFPNDNLLCSMQGLLKAYNEGKISYYMDMSTSPSRDGITAAERELQRRQTTAVVLVTA